MLPASSLNDDLLYESRLNALIFAFSPLPRHGVLCLRRYLGLLARIRQMHTLLRRGTMQDASLFVRQMQWYCELAYIAHGALQEVGRSEDLLKRLNAAGDDRRAYGMKGRNLFFLALDQPRKMCNAPPFGEISAVEDVAAFIDLVKTDIARIELLCDIGSQVNAPFDNSTMDLCHPTRFLVDRDLLSLVSPVQSKMITVYQFSDLIIGVFYEARGRLVASFVIDLYGASVQPINQFAVALRNEADHDCVVLKADGPDEMSQWLKRVNHSISALSPDRSQWMDDNCSVKCVRCFQPFTIAVRRHHCRRCGSLVCNKCSNRWVMLPYIDGRRRCRICDSCYEVRKYTGSRRLSSSEYELILVFLSFMERNILRRRLCSKLLSDAKIHQSDLNTARSFSPNAPVLVDQLHDLWIHFESMYSSSCAFVETLSHLVTSWKEDVDQNVGDMLSNHACFFGELSSYISDLNNIAELLIQEQALINDVLRPIRQISPMKDTAVQILEATPENHPDFMSLTVIIQVLQDCASSALEAISRFEGNACFAELELKFSKQISLYRPGRAFISEGALKRQTLTRKVYTIMLFSDLILIAKSSPTGLLVRWRIETLVHLPCVRRIDDKCWRLSWLSSCITFEPLQPSQWVHDIVRITSRAAHSSTGAVLQPNNWVPDSADSSCSICSKSFSMIVRRHHCRYCGDLVCHQCSAGRISLAGDKGNVVVRVCDKCRPNSAFKESASNVDEGSDDEIEVEDTDAEDSSPSMHSSFSGLVSTSFRNIPENWMCNADANSCLICDRHFTFGRRRHHCRECGALVCKMCSASRMIVEHISKTERVRVCDRCAPAIADRSE